MWTSKDVYYVSDSTALLAEDMGRALLCQFQEINFHEEKIPFIRTREDAHRALDHIRELSGGRRPLVLCTIMDTHLRRIFDSPEVEFFDIFGNILDQLEVSLETRALRAVGYSRTIDDTTLAKRVDAIHFSIEHDDGTKVREYDEAEVILVGVSRSGKTPVSVYLATHMGVKSANFPLTADHLDSYELPPDIIRNLKKVVGLTTSPQQLHRIREQRYSGSSYARLSTCSHELHQAQEIYQKYAIPSVSTDGKSIEELSVQVTQLIGLPTHSWRTI